MNIRIKRFLIAFATGCALAVVYVSLMLTSTFDVIADASPILCKLIDISFYPSEWLLSLVQWLRLPPHGDEGFVWFIILPCVQWIIIGTFIGLVWAIYGKKR